MYDSSHTPWKTLPDLVEDHDPLPVISRSMTPLPDTSRTLCRTISYASIDTVLPTNSKGVRRRNTEIDENLKHKSTDKRKQSLSTQDGSKDAARDMAKLSSPSKSSKCRRKGAVPLQDSLPKCGSQNAATTPDKLHSGIPSEGDITLISLRHDSDSLSEPLPKEDEKPLADGSALNFSRISRVHIKEVQIIIQPLRSDVTIWDGLQATHHLFQCRVFLKCIAHPFDSVAIPDIHCFEFDCLTHPPASRRHVRPPVLQTSYKGASPRWVDDKPSIDFAAGIHMDKIWRTIRKADGMWGWYRDAFIPLSPRLFDKVDYREFRLVGRAWSGKTCVEGTSKFGISMLLRGVDMK